MLDTIIRFLYIISESAEDLRDPMSLRGVGNSPKEAWFHLHSKFNSRYEIMGDKILYNGKPYKLQQIILRNLHVVRLNQIHDHMD